MILWIEGKRDNDDNDRNRDNDSKEDSVALSPTKEAVIRTTGGLTREEGEAGGVQPQLLHSGPLLGDTLLFLLLLLLLLFIFVLRIASKMYLYISTYISSYISIVVASMIISTYYYHVIS